MDISKLPFSKYRTANGGMFFLSGQVGLNEEKRLISAPPGVSQVSAETAQTIHNVSQLLSELGLTLSDVVDVTVYLRDMTDFGEMNKAYEVAFSAPYPARTCVQGAPPVGALVELKVVAAARTV